MDLLVFLQIIIVLANLRPPWRDRFREWRLTDDSLSLLIARNFKLRPDVRFGETWASY